LIAPPTSIFTTPHLEPKNHILITPKTTKNSPSSNNSSLLTGTTIVFDNFFFLPRENLLAGVQKAQIGIFSRTEQVAIGHAAHRLPCSCFFPISGEVLSSAFW
jgi:hypothetical protein